jgi:hypothetical protein
MQFRFILTAALVFSIIGKSFAQFHMTELWYSEKIQFHDSTISQIVRYGSTDKHGFYLRPYCTSKEHELVDPYATDTQSRYENRVYCFPVGSYFKFYKKDKSIFFQYYDTVNHYWSHIQAFSLLMRDTIPFRYSLPFPFDVNGNTRAFWTGYDTSITIGEQQYKCYSFVVEGLSLNQDGSSFTVRHMYVDKKSLLPFYIEDRSYVSPLHSNSVRKEDFTIPWSYYQLKAFRIYVHKNQ